MATYSQLSCEIGSQSSLESLPSTLPHRSTWSLIFLQVDSPVVLPAWIAILCSSITRLIADHLFFYSWVHEATMVSFLTRSRQVFLLCFLGITPSSAGITLRRYQAVTVMQLNRLYLGLPVSFYFTKYRTT